MPGSVVPRAMFSNKAWFCKIVSSLKVQKKYLDRFVLSMTFCNSGSVGLNRSGINCSSVDGATQGSNCH